MKYSNDNILDVIFDLKINEIPNDVIKCIFDTGGTGLDTHEKILREKQLFISYNALKKLYYLLKHFVKLQDHSKRNDNNDSFSNINGLWNVLTSAEARDHMFSAKMRECPEELSKTKKNININENNLHNSFSSGKKKKNERSEAVYRCLLGVLYGTILNEISSKQVQSMETMTNTVVSMKTPRCLTKAIVSGTIYLLWLQINGGSAYGIFMPFIYRQVLRIIKRWIDFLVSNNETSSDPKQANKRRKTRNDKDDHGVPCNTDKENSLDEFTTILNDGILLLNAFKSFLGVFSFSTTKTSLVPTVDAIVYLNCYSYLLTSCSNNIVSSLYKSAQRIFQAFFELESRQEQEMVDNHDTIKRFIERFKICLHRLLPVISMKEYYDIEKIRKSHINSNNNSSSSITRPSLKCHKMATDLVDHVFQALRKRHTPKDICSEYNNICFSFVQHLMVGIPDKTEDRQRILSFLINLIDKSYLSTNEIILHLADFLETYSKNVKPLYRQSGVEFVLSSIVLPSIFVDKSIRIRFINLLIERANDKVSTVRAKAIFALTGILYHSNTKRDTEALLDVPSCNEDETYFTSKNIDPRFPNAMNDFFYKDMPNRLSTIRHLFRERLSDEKTHVRKNTIKGLEIMIVNNMVDNIQNINDDIFLIQKRCSDNSVLVRNQAMKTLTVILLHCTKEDSTEQKENIYGLWSNGVLPLSMDPEQSVQNCCSELVDKVIFKRVLIWQRNYQKRNETNRKDQMMQSDDNEFDVWLLLSLVGTDGAMIRSLQKALHKSKICPSNLLLVAKTAIEYSIRAHNNNNIDRVSLACWSFGWLLFEEFAKKIISNEAETSPLTDGNKSLLLSLAEKNEIYITFIIRCWKYINNDTNISNKNENKIMTLSTSRILFCIGAVSSIIDAEEAKEIAEILLSDLIAFKIPIVSIANSIKALHCLCIVKTPNQDVAKEITRNWASQILYQCEQSILNYLLTPENKTNDNRDEELIIQRQLFTIGEISLIEFDKDNDKSQNGLIDIPDKILFLVQSLLPPSISFNNANNNVYIKEFSNVIDRKVPEYIRNCAFVTLGKLCLRDKVLAKRSIPLLARELEISPSDSLRSNILIIITDLCVRYTSLVDNYIPTVAQCLIKKRMNRNCATNMENGIFIRKNCLLLLSQLILQDYIKWPNFSNNSNGNNTNLFSYFLFCAIDDDSNINYLGRYLLKGPLLLKNPLVIINKFISVMFLLNGVPYASNNANKFFTLSQTQSQNLMASQDRNDIEKISEDSILLQLAGEANRRKRMDIYMVMLSILTDEQKLQLSNKLAVEIIDEINDNALLLTDNTENGPNGFPYGDTSTEMLLTDVFMLLKSPQLRISACVNIRGNINTNIQNQDGTDVHFSENPVSTVPSSANNDDIEKAKRNLLDKISKKNFLENIIPIIISLKYKLIKEKSILLKDLHSFLIYLLKHNKKNINEILANDPQTAKEIEYDLLHQEINTNDPQEANTNDPT